jgi:hypothetical protein
MLDCAIREVDSPVGHQASHKVLTTIDKIASHLNHSVD